ncbi:hypothetical protein ITJ86_12355 [Winogradskyella sp. F6397]|uniref:Uncharacterized protein n=1 Tax=Winogradskyella marina TaxID=2785530 RepID=A0ABS0EJQ5_9FLAO|nr:hypothetical protein [Winogradskyella marina]MBF8150695.1 hypothetical protein [Winogradskyella marina]
MENFSSFGFLSFGIERWQKPKVLKYAAGSMKHNVFVYGLLRVSSN